MSVIFESFWLWYLTGVVLWGFLGLLIASGFGVSPWLGALVGAVFWFLGAATLLILGLVRAFSQRSHARTTAPFESGFSDRGLAPASSGLATSGGFGGTSGGFAQEFGQEATGFPLAGSSGPFGAAGFDAFASASFSPPAHAVAPSVTPDGTGRRRLGFLGRGHLAVGAGALAAAGMLVSVVLPWGRGSVAWSSHHSHIHAGLRPAAVGPVATAVIFSALVVLAASFAMHRAPRGVWPALAAMAGAWWFALIVQWLLVVAGFSSWSGTVDGLAGDRGSASVSTAGGAWLMLASCVGVFAWCTVVTADLLRGRSTGRYNRGSSLVAKFGRK